MNNEFFLALEMLEKERGIPCSYMFEKIEAALASAFKKEYGSNAIPRIVIDPEKKDVRVFRQYNVVEEVSNPQSELSLEEARAINKRAVVGKVIETEMKTKEISRISAGVAKQMITQGIREAERQLMQEAYENKREEIVLATVNKIDLETGNVILDTENGTLSLHKSDQIPGETYNVGDELLIYVQEINRAARGPIISVSRVHSGFIRRLFELHIPEIESGVVVIKGIAREAGSRTKISVMSTDESVDPVGSCIGSHGMRISSITAELYNEKVDIVKYCEEPEEYVRGALAPAKVNSVEMIAERSCIVRVDADQLSLAIGKEGQNARLAAKLTGVKIDIKAQEQEEE